MNFEDVLTHRRSIRRYTDQPVAEEELTACLQAALLAPSWKNSQTARFYVIRTGDVMDRMKTDCLPEFNVNNVKNAPVLVVETFVKDKSGWGNDGQPANEGENGWGWYDLGLATENFCLQAEALKLGTLIMGIRDEQALRTLLDIPAEEQVGAVISLGHPDIDPVMPARMPLEERVRFF